MDEVDESMPRRMQSVDDYNGRDRTMSASEDSDNEDEGKPLLPDKSSAGRHHLALSEGRMDMSQSTEGLVADPREQEPRARMTMGRLFVVASILVTELCERLTYYSVVANMVLFCTSKLKYSDNDASVITLVFAGTVMMIPVIGGYVADAWAGKYNTILGSGLIYLLGLFLLPASAIDYTDWFGSGENLSLEARKAYFFLGLIFIAIGTGGIKANVGPFGAQQVDELGADAVQSFFNWFYWFINAGAVVAYSAVAYVQQEVGFDYGFMIPLISMLVAIIIFIIAKNRYIQRPLGDSILTQSVRVCFQSANKCNRPSWNHAREKHGGKFDDNMVDGVRCVVRVIPIFLLIIVYWAVYSQMSTSLFLQSERMDISVGDVKLPAAMLNIFNTIIILILIPIMDRLVYPALAKIGRSPTHLQRMGIGMVLVACAMAYAGGLEIGRKMDIEDNGFINQSLADKTFNASHLSMFAQIPEFAFIGGSEVFTSISGLEFAYTQAPDFMQGLIMGLFLMTNGLGSYLASAIVAIVNGASDGVWFPEEPNDGHMEYLLFLLAALTIVNLLVFVVVAKSYKYKVPDFENYNAPDKEIDVPTYTNSTAIDTSKHNEAFQAEPDSTKL